MRAEQHGAFLVDAIRPLLPTLAEARGKTGGEECGGEVCGETRNGVRGETGVRACTCSEVMSEVCGEAVSERVGGVDGTTTNPLSAQHTSLTRRRTRVSVA